ncbi:MAG: tetratricopeptide repeat protein, partial [Bacteroidia bacterium]|nr:tetratricopeptide repeat protein [Bacteroidia bacterium]
SVLIDAKKLIISGNVKDAEGLLREYVDRYREDPAGFFELAKILAAQQSYEESLIFAEKSYDLDKNNIWYQLFLAEIYQQTHDYEGALKIYEEIVATNPDNLDYYYQLAALYLGLNKYQQAIKIYSKIETRIGITEEISLQKKKIYFHLKDYTKAENELKKLIDANPNESRFYGILAEFYMSREKKKEALDLYHKILQIDPDNAYIHMTLADYYRKEGEKEKAFEELKLGFSNPNLDVDTKVNILLSFYTINEIVSSMKSEAFELAELLVETHPEDPKVYSIYGDLLSQDQQFEKARDAFLQVIELDSGKYIVWEELLRMDLLMSDYEHLRQYGNLAVELYPEQPVTILFTALAELQLKKYREAKKLLDQGLKLVVNNNELLAQYYMYQGDVFHAMDEIAKSDEAYEKSLQIKDNNPYLLNNYSYYLALRGVELEKAEQMAKKAVTMEPENSSFQDTYGWVLYKLGRFEQAKEWVEKSMADQDNLTGEVLEHYGDILYQLGKKEKALRYWKLAVEKGDGSEFLNDKIEQQKLIEK